MIRKAKAIWRGTGRDGSGNLSTASGVLAKMPYSYETRFENERGTNPEELIAAAHAGCFTMALAFGLQKAGYTPTELSTEAVTLISEGQGFRISRSALSLRASVKDVEEGAGTSCKSSICARMVSQSFRVVLFVCARIADPCSRIFYRANRMT